MRKRLARAIAAGAAAAVVMVPTAAASADEPPADEGYTEQVLAVGQGGDSNQTPPYGHELGAFFNYRIPAIVQLGNGDLVASYDGRPTGADSPGPNSILQRRSTDDGRTWGPEEFIHEGKVADPAVEGDLPYGYSDPSYVYDEETGTLFNFHVYSKDTGFADGAYGNDDEDRSVMSMAVSVSTDDGNTWEHRLITEAIKTDDMRAAFASSGHGIQIKNGPHAGRLVLQYAGSFDDGTIKAFSVYSDDHGETWQRGEAVGTAMDENKVVELSDGTLMMNSRIHSGPKARWVAYSEDGGHTWSEPEVDHTLIDPVNNGSIIRKNPDAEPGSPESKELLFSNSASTQARQNGTVRYSCDDGETWPVAKTFAPGGTSYSDLVALQDGSYGVFYEGEAGELRYGSFTEDWLGAFCLTIEPVEMETAADETGTATVVIRNDDERELPAGEVTAEVGEGWTAETVELPALAPGEETTVSVEVTPAEGARPTSTPIPADITVTAGQYALRGSLRVAVTPGVTAPGGDVEHSARQCLDGLTDGNGPESPRALNMVANCSFEDQDYISNQRDWSLFGADDSSRIATESLEDGTENTFALIDTGAYDNHIWQAVPTVPGRTYTVSADIRVGVIEGYTPSNVYFAAKGMNPDGSQNQGATTQLDTGELVDATEWTRKSFTFTAVNWNTFVGTIRWAAQDADGHVANTTIAMDNLSVIEEQSYELVWNEEFDGDALDQGTWGYELGNVRGNEQQHYSSSSDNVDVRDGNLVLTATDRPEEDQYRNLERWGDDARQVKYNSGSVRTQGREEFMYGRIEARMSLPEGKGVFPAFWTLGADFHLDGRINMEHGYSWPSTGELDIMEIVGAPTEERAAQGEVGKEGNSNAVTYGTPHFYYGDEANGNPDRDGSYAPTAMGGSLQTVESFSENYHVFGIDWTPEYIAYYVDGVVYNIQYFPTEDTTRAGNEAFVASEIERFQAAADSMNRPQYLQFNLATGGNWAGDAGDHLAEDGTEVKVDWVRYYRTAAQQEAAEAYYADQPEIIGADNRVMRAGEAADLLEGVSSTGEGHAIEYSIDNEQMFVNGGVSDGRNEVSLVVEDSSDTEALESLEPGVYSLHYSSLEEGVTYSGYTTPQARAARTTVLLTVLPAEGLSGTEGGTLESVALPEGWAWADPTQALGGEEAQYAAVFTNAADTVTDPEKRRQLAIEIPAEQITLNPAEEQPGEEPGDGSGEELGDGAGQTPDGDPGQAPDEGTSDTAGEQPGAGSDGTRGDGAGADGDGEGGPGDAAASAGGSGHLAMTGASALALGLSAAVLIGAGTAIAATVRRTRAAV